MNGMYLIHHGIIGQKWGVRRYQNKDGSLTQLGKNHYGQNSNKGDLAKKIIDRSNEINTYNDNINKINSNAKKVDHSVNRIKNNSKNKQNLEELSKMTDEELRRRVNRLNMEQQYKNLTNTKDALRGEDYVREALEIAGGLAGIAASAAVIYSTIMSKK